MTHTAPRLSDLLAGAAIEPLDALTADPAIRGVQLDSRRVGDGDLFFALKGEHADGERFVPQAIERGARAIVAASVRPAGLDEGVAWIRVEQPRSTAGPLSREFFGRPDERLALVGITGTNGKTTPRGLRSRASRSRSSGRRPRRRTCSRCSTTCEAGAPTSWRWKSRRTR